MSFIRILRCMMRIVLQFLETKVIRRKTAFYYVLHPFPIVSILNFAYDRVKYRLNKYRI